VFNQQATIVNQQQITSSKIANHELTAVEAASPKPCAKAEDPP
jgi:hypothetical protein